MIINFKLFLFIISQHPVSATDTALVTLTNKTAYNFKLHATNILAKYLVGCHPKTVPALLLTPVAGRGAPVRTARLACQTLSRNPPSLGGRSLSDLSPAWLLLAHAMKARIVMIICILAMSSAQQNVTTEETSKYPLQWSLLHICGKTVGSNLRIVESIYLQALIRRQDILTNQLTTYLSLWNCALLQRTPFVQPFDIFTSLHGVRRFITPFTKSRSLVPVLSYTNPVHATSSYLYKIHLNVISPAVSWSS